MERRFTTPRWSLLICLAFACLAVICIQAWASSRGSASEDTRVVLVSLDGMADWLLDELLEAGALPNIKRLLRKGKAADYSIPTYPAITAVGNAALWTGTDPSHSGIHGNTLLPLPYSEHSIVDTFSGFDADNLMAEPIWITAARQGKKVVVQQVTQGAPFDVYFGDGARFPATEENLIIFDGYSEGGLNDEALTANIGFERASNWQNLPEHSGEPLEFHRTVGETLLRFLLIDDPADPVEGYDTLAICYGRDGVECAGFLEPEPARTSSAESFSSPIKVVVNGKETTVFFRLFHLSQDGDEMLLYRSRIKHLICSDPQRQAEMRAAAGGFTGNSADGLYEVGALGEPIFTGGDGKAEIRYLETSRHCAELSTRALIYAMENYDWDLLLGYLPFPDEQNHLWLGFVSEPTGDKNSEIGKRIWSSLLETYKICDDYIGRIMDSLPDDAVLIVVSDHGFSVANRRFYPNTVLRNAGLLALNQSGEVDIQKTRAVYFPGNGGFVLVNSTRFKNGIIDPDVEHLVEEKAKKALLAATDNRSRKIVTGIFEPDEDPELGMDGPFAGDFYIQLAPGIYPMGEVDSEVTIEQSAPFGIHHGDPRDRLMHSIFLIGGKPVSVEGRISEMRAVDVAPTVCALLGIEPPAGATGRVRREVVMLVDKPRKAACTR